MTVELNRRNPAREKLPVINTANPKIPMRVAMISATLRTDAGMVIFSFRVLCWEDFETLFSKFPRDCFCSDDESSNLTVFTHDEFSHSTPINVTL